MQAFGLFYILFCSQITAYLFEYSGTNSLVQSIKMLASGIYYLFENCGARLAALRPYFFLSFIRGSLVK